MKYSPNWVQSIIMAINGMSVLWLIVKVGNTWKIVMILQLSVEVF